MTLSGVLTKLNKIGRSIAGGCLFWGAIFAAVGTPIIAATPAEELEEAQAFHIGSLAYLYGFPAVDMTQAMFNETHAASPEQRVLAPVNQFFRFRERVTPATAGSLRAPNADTLYLSGWFDLQSEPVIIRAPDTQGRYYTLAVTDFNSEVQHVGRRTTGTAARDFVLVGPAFVGNLPEGLHVVRVPTHRAWVLGRVMVGGQDDLESARNILESFQAIGLSDWQRGITQTERSTPPSAEAVRLVDSLAFFETLNTWLRNNPRPPEEAALLAQFDAVGFGPARIFSAEQASAATRRGLLRAIESARQMLIATSRRPLSDIRRGWIFPLALGQYGYDYLMRATVAFSGYANLPEETVYGALTSQGSGVELSGARRYILQFTADDAPPVGAFWSISAYRSRDYSLIENSLGRYSIGPHVSGFKTRADGSFAIVVSREAPADDSVNWLPIDEEPFYLIMRMYEPARAVLDGRYQPPAIEVLEP